MSGLPESHTMDSDVESQAVPGAAQINMQQAHAGEGSERVTTTGSDASIGRHSGTLFPNAVNASAEEVCEGINNATSERLERLYREARGTMRDLVQMSTTTGSIHREQFLRITKTHEKFSNMAKWSFTYGNFVVIAGLMAGFGLAADSATSIVASMLVSPIMGPVIGLTYGLFVQDYGLARRSCLREVQSLFLCILLGVIVGLLTSWWPEGITGAWPTEQMQLRGSYAGFVSDIPVAFLSGLGVALSVGNEDVGSLVGVAISASLLPPAVNAGLMWTFAVLSGAGLVSKGTDYNFVRGGVFSLGLTVMNIVLVFIGALAMFRLQERLPIEKGDFWHDLTHARRINTNRALVEEEIARDDDGDMCIGKNESPLMVPTGDKV